MAAANSSADTKDRLIFAPAGSKSHAQAEQFLLSTLTRADLDPESPIPQFHRWFTLAQNASTSADDTTTPSIPHPETCTLSTASLPSGRVSARMVYLKELDAQGRFVVYTNLGTSRKAADLATNAHAALVFWWEAQQRQVRVEGAAVRMTAAESQTYFDTRQRGSRIGAWASRQSERLEPEPAARQDGGGAAGAAEATPDDGRKKLEAWVKEAEEKFEGVEHVPVPDFWGGLRIVPDRIEFWQGRDSRLHDRFVYEKVGDKWELSRLSP